MAAVNKFGMALPAITADFRLPGTNLFPDWPARGYLCKWIVSRFGEKMAIESSISGTLKLIMAAEVATIIV